MDFTTIGSLGQYMKTVKLQTRWELRRRTGDLTSHSDSTNESDKRKLKNIRDKAFSGKKLTPAEKRYLQANDAAAYQRLQSVEEDRKNYERELKHCRTREEVQRAKLNRLNTSMMTVKSVENNPHIPEEKKREIAAAEKLRCEKIEASTRTFVRRGEYAKLPTELEQAKAEREERESGEAGQVPESGREATPEHGNSIQPEPKKRINVESPERRKVRRAKARAAYARFQNGAAEETEIPSLNLEA